MEVSLLSGIFLALCKCKTKHLAVPFRRLPFIRIPLYFNACLIYYNNAHYARQVDTNLFWCTMGCALHRSGLAQVMLMIWLTFPGLPHQILGSKCIVSYNAILNKELQSLHSLLKSSRIWWKGKEPSFLPEHQENGFRRYCGRVQLVCKFGYWLTGTVQRETIITNIVFATGYTSKLS